MDFTMPQSLTEEITGFKEFIKDHIISNLPDWYRRREIPAELFRQMGVGGWYGFELKEGRLFRGSALREQVLTVFTHSRVPIAAITLGTAVGAFELALEHARMRKIFGQTVTHFQAKTFEAADFYAKIEAARLMLYKACWKIDQN